MNVPRKSHQTELLDFRDEWDWENEQFDSGYATDVSCQSFSGFWSFHGSNVVDSAILGSNAIFTAVIIMVLNRMMVIVMMMMMMLLMMMTNTTTEPYVNRPPVEYSVRNVDRPSRFVVAGELSVSLTGAIGV